MIGGVAGGLGHYFEIDPVLLRLAFVFLAFATGGVAIIAYIVAWIVMPEADTGTGKVYARRGGDGTSAAIIFGIILVVAGAIWLLAALDVDSPAAPWRLILAAILIVVGLAIVIEARRGLHGGLVTLAVALTAVLALTSTVSFELESGFGERFEDPTSIAQLESSYSHAFGSMTLDLTGLEIPDGETTEVSINMAFGEVVVRVPDGVEYRVESNTVFGSTQAAGEETGGIATNRDFQTSGYDGASRRLLIEINNAFGSAQVQD